MSGLKHVPQRASVVAAAAVVAGLSAHCGGAHTTTTGPTPILVSLTPAGPDAIAPRQTVAFTVTGLMNNGTTEDYTRKVTWSSFPASVLTIVRDTGVATAQAAGDATIVASFSSGTGRCCSAQLTRTVLPPNTFRLTGRVSESGLPVSAAAIVVLSGIGAGLSTTTDGDGAYRFYGVAGTIQVKFSKPGYDDVVKTFTAVQNDVLDFPDAHQTAGIPSLAGAYTLTLTADPACPTTVTRGVAALPDEFRQPRSYSATLTQNGPLLSVTLTDAQIVSTHNHFTGRIDPDAIEFDIGGGYYYGYAYGGITEQLSPTQEFVFEGVVRAQRNGNVITGPLDGGLAIRTLPALRVSAQCIAPNNVLTLTRSAQPSRHR